MEDLFREAKAFQLINRHRSYSSNGITHQDMAREYSEAISMHTIASHPFCEEPVPADCLQARGEIPVLFLNWRLKLDNVL